MRIYEAAQKVLAEAGGPMHASAIYEEIVRLDLYKFGAKSPISVLSQSMSERAVGNTKQREEIFVRTAPGTYELAGKS